MAHVAQTTLLVDKDDKTVTIEEGREVKKSDAPSEDVFTQWVADGSVVEVAKSASEAEAQENAEKLQKENEDLAKKVAELEKQLAEAKKSSTPAPSAPAGDKK